jgi:hypothetical protein
MYYGTPISILQSAFSTKTEQKEPDPCEAGLSLGQMVTEFRFLQQAVQAKEITPQQTPTPHPSSMAAMNHPQ